MQVEKTQNHGDVTLWITGRLDTSTASQLETEIQNSMEGITSLVLDLSKLDYISSAGLRVLLSAHKKMLPKGGMVIRNVCESVMEILALTGFTDFLTIEA